MPASPPPPPRSLGTRCEVFVPEVSPEAKRARLRPGAQVVVAGPTYAEALQACLERQREPGALLTHAYDQPEVVAGAGTLALEMEEQARRLPDSVLVSVGGGGLIGGIAAWCGRARVVALEPEGAPTLHGAPAAGMPVDVAVGGIAADSLGAKRIGDIAWQVSQRHVQESLLVSDDAIRAAQQWLWHELKLAVEPAAALASRPCRRRVPPPARRDRGPGALRRQLRPGHRGLRTRARRAGRGRKIAGYARHPPPPQRPRFRHRAAGNPQEAPGFPPGGGLPVPRVRAQDAADAHRGTAVAPQPALQAGRPAQGQGARTPMP